MSRPSGTREIRRLEERIVVLQEAVRNEQQAARQIRDRYTSLVQMTRVLQADKNKLTELLTVVVAKYAKRKKSWIELEPDDFEAARKYPGVIPVPAPEDGLLKLVLADEISVDAVTSADGSQEPEQGEGPGGTGETPPD